MKLAEIEAKVVELALIYQDEKQGADSAAAKKLLAELVKEESDVIRDACEAAKIDGIFEGIEQETIGKILRDYYKDKFGTNNVAKNNTDTQSTDKKVSKPQSVSDKASRKRTTNDLSELGNLLKEVENQPAEPKSKPVRQKVNRNAPKAQPIEQDNTQAEQAEAKNSDVKMTPLPGKDIQAEIREFFNDGVDDYSDKLGDYLEDKENALKVLNFLQKNYTKRSGKLNSKVMFLALTAYSVGNKNEQFTDITRSIIEKLSELSIPGYLERNKEAGNTFFKDAFLCDIKTVNTAEYADLLNAISKKHVQDVLEKLSEDDRIKYLRSLNMKNGLEQFNPRAQNKQNNNKAEPKKLKTGDRTMADKDDTVKEEDSTFTPSAIQINACKLAGITDIEKFKSEAELLKAIENAHFKIEGGKIINLNTGEEVPTEGGKSAEEDKGGKPAGDGKDEKPAEDGKDGKPAGDGKELNVEGEGDGRKPKPEEIEAPELAGWIKKKIKDYNDMKDGKLEGCPKLTDYHHDDTVKDGFAADFNGGRIHYTSPNNVTVSKESGLTIFEALVTEPDNKGRVVNFGANLEHTQAVMLFAACIMHGNPIGENPPKISQADMDMLKEELVRQGREEDWNNLAAKFKELSGGEKKAFDDETKGKIKEALDRQYEMAAMESSGQIKYINTAPLKIEYSERDDKGNLVYSKEKSERYMELRNMQKDDKELLGKKFLENEEGVREIVRELLNEKTGEALKKRTEEQKMDLAAARKAQIEAIRAKKSMEAGKKEGTSALDEHNEKLREKDKRDHEISVALGIESPTDEENKAGKKALTGKELEDFVAANHVTKSTYERLTNKLHKRPTEVDGKRTFDASKLTKEQKEVYDKLPVDRPLTHEKGGRGA